MHTAGTTRHTPVAAVLAAIFVFAALVCECPAVTLTMLPVGNPGNAIDPRPFANIGAVNYQYWLDKYDVTNAQYVEFLNAKASAADPFGLYHVNMADSDLQGGIDRSPGAPFTYSAKAGMSNKPVVWVSSFDAMRFTNWLTNGQGNGDTESGSYLITGGLPNNGVVTIPDATQRALWSTTSKHYLLPSANEWYKAAFYKGGGTNAGYWSYPFATNTPPTSGPPGTFHGANVALFPNTALPGPVHLTDVGAYNYPGPYGQMDLGGNVDQFTDSRMLSDTQFIDFRGGGWNTEAVSFQGGGGLTPDDAIYYAGFRVMMVPEPGSVTLLLLAAVSALFAWRRGGLRRRWANRIGRFARPVASD